jgi:hypothetical protein
MPFFVKDIQRNLYTRYYGVTEMTKFPRDPRRRQRAWQHCIMAMFPGLMLSLGVLTWIPAIVFGVRIEPNPLIRLIPGVGFYWLYKYNFATYTNAATARQVHLVLGSAEAAALAIAAIGGYYAWRVFERWLLDATGLSTEHGSDRWALPEDLLAPQRQQDRLLPEDYDLRRGFSKKDKLALLRSKQLSDKLRADRAIVAKENQIDEHAANRIGPGTR